VLRIIDNSVLTQSQGELDEIGGHVSSLANLVFDSKHVSMYHDAETLKAEYVDDLRRANLIPPREKLEPIFSGEDLEELGLDELDRDKIAEKPKRVGPGRPVVDLLGEYSSSDRTIIIYDKMCLLVGSALKINPSVLRRVVAAHEVSHAVTHMGRHEGEIWKEFADADRMDKELLAQAYCLFYLKKMKDTAALRAFYKMARHQDFIYNTWKTLADEDIEVVNEAHLRARRKGRYMLRDMEEMVPELEFNLLPHEELLAAIEERIDLIEGGVNTYKREHADAPSNLMSVAKLLGKGKEYDNLLRKNFEIDTAMKSLKETTEMLDGIKREIAVYRENHPELPNRRIELADRVGKREAYLDLLERRLDLERDLLRRYRKGIWEPLDL
jgi:hypothetical protein